MYGYGNKKGEQIAIKRKKEYTHHFDPTLKASRKVKYSYMLILKVVVKRKCVPHNVQHMFRPHLGPESSTACNSSDESSIRSEWQQLKEKLGTLNLCDSFVCCDASHRFASPSPSSILTTSDILVL
jgi:hypothetical protein